MPVKTLSLALFLLLFDPAGHARVGSAAFQISVNVDLVVLHATVRDKKGQTVPDLGQQDFEVYEEGVRQDIRLFRHEDSPVTVGLVIDHSGSMKSKISDVVSAARLFVQSSSPADEMFVVNFNDAVTLGLPQAVGLTSDANILEHAISRTPAAGMTRLYDAMATSMGQLSAGKLEKKVMVVISDGGDNASAHMLDDVLRQVGASNVIIYTIGIFGEDDPDQNSTVLRRIAAMTGGEAFFPARFSDVVEICGRIGREIRSQYTIGYTPAGTAKAGAWRRVQVKGHGEQSGRLVVRTRSGYRSARLP